jgi:hypothetical protein
VKQPAVLFQPDREASTGVVGVSVLRKNVSRETSANGPENTILQNNPMH